MSSQRRLVSVPGSVLITWLWHVYSRDEWSTKMMTSSHISHVSAWGFLSLAAVSGLPHRAATRGQFTKCHKHLRLLGIMGARMLFIPPSGHPSSLFKSHPQLDVILVQVLVTLWVWLQPTVPRIHPSRAFFVLVYHPAAMLSVCEGHDIPVCLCLSGCGLWTSKL